MESRRRLSRPARLVLVVGISAVTIFALAVGAAAAAIYGAGSIRVKVRSEQGTNFSIRVPAGLANLAIALVPSAPLRELGRDFEPWSGQLDRVWPVLTRSYDELAAAPDFVLVEVHGDDEQILVRKEDGHLIVDVSSHGDDVHIVVPLRTVSRALDKLERGLI